jgi:hypothetical protein
MPARPVSVSSLAPDLFGKSASIFCWRRVNHRHGVSSAHRTALATERHDGIEPLSEVLSAASRIVLTGLSAKLGTPKHVAATHIAATAGPKQIVRFRVLLVAVYVAHFHVARRATQYAYSGARRWAGVSAVT